MNTTACVFEASTLLVKTYFTDGRSTNTKLLEVREKNAEAFGRGTAVKVVGSLHNEVRKESGLWKAKR